ncbi:MAG: hypothetical protein DRI69_09115 [Bacteroidetes bacterium]|nr:MAG: hypothetical protein DRI69_09115 [Bacteroidota bacterium]
MNQSRQLAAIMFVDIVGYTAMMQDDEESTLVLRNKLKSTLKQELASHGGKMVQFNGDGALCSFDSATESVRAAVAIQLMMLQEPKVPLRIGIHQADVIFQGSEVIGDGVNIASRLESLAIPGSILISSKVHDDIKNQNDIQAISLGKYLLKNISEPIEIYSISNPGLEVPHKTKLVGKGVKYFNDKVTFGKKSLFIKLLIFAAIIGVLGYQIIPQIFKKQKARHDLLPMGSAASKSCKVIPIWQRSKGLCHRCSGITGKKNLWTRKRLHYILISLNMTRNPLIQRSRRSLKEILGKRKKSLLMRAIITNGCRPGCIFPRMPNRPYRRSSFSLGPEISIRRNLIPIELRVALNLF